MLCVNLIRNGLYAQIICLEEIGPKYSSQAVTVYFSLGVNPSPKLQVRYSCPLPLKFDYKIFLNAHTVDI